MTTEEKIWQRLKAAGYNDFGIAGLMGNLYAESALSPTNLQNTYEKKLGMNDTAYTAAVDKGTYANFAKDCAGYGLAQWTYPTRKKALLDFAKSKGKSIGDLDMQLDFLIKEITGYTGVCSTLKSAKSVRAASDKVLLEFERPADQSEQSNKDQQGQQHLLPPGSRRLCAAAAVSAVLRCAFSVLCFDKGHILSVGERCRETRAAQGRSPSLQKRIQELIYKEIITYLK